MKLIDFPKKISYNYYDKAINNKIDYLSRFSQVLSVYQIGNVKHPGISDIDLLVIFKNDVVFEKNPLINSDKVDKYLFSHNLFGLSQYYFNESMNYSFFSNFKLLYGKKNSLNNSLKKDEIKKLKKQIALEYLIKNYIVLTMQLKYKILKVRTLLLEINAIKFDLDFLNIKNKKINSFIEELIHFRDNWYNAKPTNTEIIAWTLEFYTFLEQLINEELTKTIFYVGSKKQYIFNNNIKLTKSNSFYFNHTGFNVSLIKYFYINKKIFNLHNRFNFFNFYIPYNDINDDCILKDKKYYERNVINYNKLYLPYFTPLKTSLNLT